VPNLYHFQDIACCQNSQIFPITRVFGSPLPSLEVARTTLLLIYSFWLWSAFLPLKRNCFSQFHFHPKKNIPVWPWTLIMTLTHEIYKVRVKLNHCTRYLGLCQRSVCLKVFVRTHRHTHSWPTALCGPQSDGHIVSFKYMRLSIKLIRKGRGSIRCCWW